jgi:hypothetical protein
MWGSLLGKLRPESVAKRDTCFARLASAVLQGDFDFSSAIVSSGSPAETADTVLAQHDLASLLAAAPTSEAVAARPAELGRFLQRGPVSDCADKEASCSAWAAAGECTANPDFMRVTCKRACGSC